MKKGHITNAATLLLIRVISW